MTEPSTTSPSPSYDESRAEHARRRLTIAGGVNSNVRLAGTPVPLTFDRASGAHLWDVDGNMYVDYAAGMGPMILGHNHPAVTGAVRASLDTGQLFAGQNRLEAEFAEALVGALPWVESIRIGMSGTEMDLLAVRLARAATGRHKTVRFAGHYHGWLDPLFIDMSVAPDPSGPPPLTPGQSVAAASDIIVCEWNDLGQVAAALATDEVACVLMEPVMCNTGLIPPVPGYIEGVKELCSRHGALLVIDEVITGFRFGLTGAQGFLGVHGDISIYAKAIASGFPLAVLGTSTELLAPVGRGEVNHSGTYNSGVSSMAAGVATLRYLIDDDPYPEMGRITTRLADGLRSLGADAGVALAVDHIGGALFQTRFGTPDAITSRADFAERSDKALLARFLEQLQHHGVRPTGRGLWFVSAAHDDAVVDATLAAASAALSGL
ncbi:MAG: aminotransferase class III-fold pyridoxal phosphate-dependent enzyme [Ilumatobacteraceae bacterium]